MEESSSRRGPMPASKVRRQQYRTIFIVALVATAGAIWLLPPMQFVFGVGLFAVGFTVFLAFLGLILFRKLLFKPLYGRQPDESETVLLEYFAQPDEDREEVSEELIENALHLREVAAADCMAPKSDMVYFPVGEPIVQLQKLFVESQLSRIVITEDRSLDRILGYIHVQQMFDGGKDLRQMVLPIKFVQADMPANELLNRFVRTRTNIACVKDASGQLLGLVTLENALEQLFGQIEDEHD
jgi:putative hemolysin